MRKHEDEKTVEIRGYWWLPEKPDHKVAGTFLFDQYGVVSITLFGTLKHDPKEHDRRAELCPLVVGYNLNNGCLMTIQDCVVHPSNETIMSIPDVVVHTEIIAGSQAFLGVICEENDDLKFNKVILELDFLRDWLVYRKPEQKFVGDNSDQFQITYPAQKADPILCKVSKVMPHFNLWVGNDITEGTNVTQSESISVELEESIGFNDWKNRVILPLSNFITLATDRWCSVKKVKVSDRSHRYAPPLPDLPVTFEVYSGFPKAEYDQDKCIFPLFTYEQVKDDIVGILDRWFGITEKYKPSCELFFSVMQASGTWGNKMHLNNQFLNLVQALESFYNIRVGRGQPHLREGLPVLINEVGEMIMPIIGDQEKFVTLAVETRNYYSHYNPSKLNISAHGYDLNNLTAALKILMHAVLLRQLNLPENVYKTLFIQHREFRELKAIVKNYGGILRDRATP